MTADLVFLCKADISICVGQASDNTANDFVSWAQTVSGGNRVITISQGASGSQTVHGTIILTGKAGANVPSTDLDWSGPGGATCNF